MFENHTLPTTRSSSGGRLKRGVRPPKEAIRQCSGRAMALWGAVTLTCAVTCIAQPPRVRPPKPQCTDDPSVRYVAPGQDKLGLTSRIRLTTLSPAEAIPPELATLARTPSPHGDSAFRSLRRGDRNTDIYVYRRTNLSPLLRLSLVDHLPVGVKVKWINEKLLFVQSWWGRVLSTDLILDVLEKRIIYMQDADYFGETLPPCTTHGEP